MDEKQKLLLESTCCTPMPNIKDTQCGYVTPKRPFKVLHNGKDSATVLNQKGEDVTEYFNIEFSHGIVIVNFKEVPTFEQWRKITGKK